jgi:ribulose-phosphate 3-epimerase
MKIIPALLAENCDDFMVMLQKAESFTDYVQIDMMDGAFVPSVSFSPQKLNHIRTSLSLEVHLMVKNPSAYMSGIDNPAVRKVIFHFESEVKHGDFIDEMKKRGLAVGMAIKPETELKAFERIAEHIDALLFLTVSPGAYGSPFRQEVMDKIKEARKMFHDKELSADGGVSLENLKLFIQAGVDSVCIGSRIFLQGSPVKNYEKFAKKLKELEVTQWL